MTHTDVAGAILCFVAAVLIGFAAARGPGRVLTPKPASYLIEVAL